jgi:class 3 adenylate cyclase/tetratricopeptide (TPR) repeat protein
VGTGEERKLVTILFADLVGSTAFASDRDPERVRLVLDRFYGTMAREIEERGGTVEKFAGDAVMAVFGAPAALEDHAERALHTALAMQNRMRALFAEFDLRIGVNTGEVVVGASHEGSSFVTGDAVNVADRLQKSAQPGQVLAGERTVASAEGAFEFGPRSTVEAKGKEQGVRSAPVLRALRSMRPRGIGSLPRVFVGRETELTLLQATYRRVAANTEPHLVTIIGEPGVGKSRLVSELSAALAAEDPPPLTRTGRCLAYGDGITYWPLGEVVREHFEIREGTASEDVVRRLEGREILGLALGLDVARDLHPLDAREQLHVQAVAFVEELASGQSAVLLVEDIHWAEPDLLDLLERLVSDVHAPVLILATARPELFDQRHAWGSGRRNATVLWLEPLTEPVASRMLEEMLPKVLPADLRELLVGRAEGNPFFLEELVGELVDSGVLVRTDGGWELGERDASFSVPDTVHAVLAARIDRLPSREKAALQAGSVVGRVFWKQPVVHLLDGEEPDFGLLGERDLVTARRESTLADDREFVIKHALTREVAYGSIPKARRGHLHASLADWLERSGLGSDERASFLAYHYSQAVNPEDADLAWRDEPEELERLGARAVHWLRRAGELARGRHEMDEAVELFTRAAELTRDDHQRALLWRDIGHAQALRYDGEAFWAAMERSLDGPLDTHERADAYSRLAFETSIRSGMWSIRPGKERIEGWVLRALELAEHGSIEETRALLARANAEPAEAPDELLEFVTSAAERSGDPDLLSFTFGARSHTAFEHLKFEEAATWIERRLALIPEIDDPDGLCEVYESAVPVVAAFGRFDEARRLASEHWEIARRLSPHHRVHAASLRLEIEETLGDWSTLAAETDLVMDLVAQNLATPCVRNARDLLLGALAHVCVGDEARARELELEAAALAGEGHERELATPRLRTALVRGDAEATRTLVRLPLMRTFVWGSTVFATLLDALTALREFAWVEREAPLLRKPGTVIEPFALRALGVVRGDDELLAQADERFASLGLDWHRAQTERLLAGL